MKNYHYVYITTNVITGKQYVGDHTTSNLNDEYLGSGKYFQNALKKYGKQNFKKEILEHFNTKEESFNAQEKYIKEYNTLIPNGYNISIKGGYGIPGSFLNEDTKNKIRKSQTGIKKKQQMINVYGEEEGIKRYENFIKKQKETNKGRNLGIKRTSEHIEKNRQAKLGTKHSEETKEKMRLSQQHRRKTPVSEETKNKMKGKKNPMYNKSVYDIWIQKYGKDIADEKWKNKYKKS